VTKPSTARSDDPSREPGRFRGPLIAVAAAVAAAAAVVVLVGPGGTMTGLLFVAGVSGFVIGAQVPSRPAIALALLGVFGGDVGAWLYARSEGGVLGLEAYLQETFGPYIAGQVAIAVLTSWWAARRAAAVRGDEPRRG